MLSDYFHFRAEVIFLVPFFIMNLIFLMELSSFARKQHFQFLASCAQWIYPLLWFAELAVSWTPMNDNYSIWTHLLSRIFFSEQQWSLVYLNSDTRWKKNPNFWKKRETLRNSLSKPITMTFPLPRQSCCESLWKLPITAEICYPLCWLG